MLSQNAEKYIGAIYRISDAGEPVGLSALSEWLSVSRVSVNEMIRKLEKDGLVMYTPYRGVSLTPTGESQALDIVRRHRTWERFLVDVMAMPWDQAHEEACELAHATSASLLEQLSEFLGQPETCPHGHAVPSPNGEIVEERGRPLGELASGQTAVVLRVPEEEPGMLTYLNQLGLRPGVSVSVQDVAPFDGPVTLYVEGTQRAIGRKLASRIIVRVS